MELRQVRGDTWVLEGNALIPVYRLGDGGCVLLDTGLVAEREEIEGALLRHGLTPRAVLCSHAHVDHCANDRYFQEKYGAKVALTAPEAGMCSHILNLKAYRLLVTPGVAEEEMAHMVHTPDLLVPEGDGPMELAGAVFQILHTPGHSSGHICATTPDGVCYAADALMSREKLDAKLPYGLSVALMLQSREKLRGVDCHTFLMAHWGTCPRGEIGALIDDNQALTLRRAGEIRDLADDFIDFSELVRRTCAFFQLRSRRARRALYYERNIRLLVEFLLDQGELEMDSRGGVVYYRAAR